jgi:hypothetical protein
MDVDYVYVSDDEKGNGYGWRLGELGLALTS